MVGRRLNPPLVNSFHWVAKDYNVWANAPVISTVDGLLVYQSQNHFLSVTRSVHEHRNPDSIGDDCRGSIITQNVRLLRRVDFQG